jgi:hypothetical protein
MSDIQKVIEQAVETAEPNKTNKPTSRMDSAIAICVAVVATFMAVSNIKDGNIVQAITLALLVRFRPSRTWCGTRRFRLYRVGVSPRMAGSFSRISR